jgi:hypothetical protein
LLGENANISTEALETLCLQKTFNPLGLIAHIGRRAQRNNNNANKA